MSFRNVVGHELQLQVLRRTIARGRVPPAYLFLGPPRVGKTLVALEFAKALNCLTPPPEGQLPDACDQCDECRRFERGSHPDFGFLQPLVRVQLEDETGERTRTQVAGSMIQVEAITELIAEAYLKPVRARRKVFVISSAEAMNEPAANKLLKTLEEPPGATTLILTAAGTANLLPTIVSRCQIVRFGPVPPRQIEAGLAAQVPTAQPDAIHIAAALSGGKFGWARDLVEQPRLLEIRRRVLALAARWARCGRLEALQGAEQLIAAAEEWWTATQTDEVAAELLKRNRDRVLRTKVLDVLDILLSWFRDLAALANGSRPPAEVLVNSDFQAELTAAATVYPRGAAQRGFDFLSEARLALAGNANLRLTLEVLLLHLIGLAHPQAADT